MYDFHSHVLPKIDDGSSSMEETAIIFDGLVNLGYTGVVASPHWAVGMPDIPEVLVEKVRHLATERGIALSTARECRIHPNLPDHVHANPRLRIDGGNVVLVELPWGPTPPYTTSVFLTLLELGYRPILVHPERHAPLFEPDSPLETLIEAGVIIQMNLQSLVGAHGQNARNRAVELLKQGKTDLVASDIHAAAELRTTLQDAHEVLIKGVGSDAADILTTHNPKALMENQPLVELSAHEIASTFDSDLFVDGLGAGGKVQSFIAKLFKLQSR